MRTIATLCLLLFAGVCRGGPARVERTVFTVDGVQVGVLKPVGATEPLRFVMVCDPGADEETLAAAGGAQELSNWWHVVYFPQPSRGSREKDFKALMAGFEAAQARGLSAHVYRTVAVTEAGRALERMFISRPKRPKPEDRCFRSAAVDAKVEEVAAKLRARGEAKLALMFENCYPNTLDTTVHYRVNAAGEDETFVYTGDIHAMWLRDSAAQVWPYLAFVKEDEPLRKMIRGVVLKQFELIRLDPYANAFNDLPADEAAQPGKMMDGVQVKKGVFERKYELDSLCYPIRLAHGYWKSSGDASVFDGRWVDTLRLILDVMREQQRKRDWKTSYFYARSSVCNNAIENYGWGRQVKPVGLIASSFRPSDDATTYPFLVPSNLMAVDVLGKAAEILRAVNRNAALAGECEALKAEVDAALRKHAVREHPTAGRIWAFEVDGYGSVGFMDDANVPSLIAIPYFTEIPKDDPLYRATRAFVWSEENPWFFRGMAGEGIGGPHCGHGSIWPMSIILKGLTADDPGEVDECLDLLQRMDADTGLMHESFDKDDAKKFTRAWFAWANTLFGELVLRRLESSVMHCRPDAQEGRRLKGEKR